MRCDEQPSQKPGKGSELVHLLSYTRQVGELVHHPDRVSTATNTPKKPPSRLAVELLRRTEVRKTTRLLGSELVIAVFLRYKTALHRLLENRLHPRGVMNEFTTSMCKHNVNTSKVCVIKLLPCFIGVNRPIDMYTGVLAVKMLLE